MDWGTVASVIVALVLFFIGIIMIMALMFGLLAGGINKKIKALGTTSQQKPESNE